MLSDNPDSAGRLPETLPRRNRLPIETPRKLAHTSQSSKSLSNLAFVPGTLTHGISSTSLSSAGKARNNRIEALVLLLMKPPSAGLRKKRTAPPPPANRPLSSAISTQALERIVDSEESLTSDMEPSKPASDIGESEARPKANSDIGVATVGTKLSPDLEPEPANPELKACKLEVAPRHRAGSVNAKLPSEEPRNVAPVEDAPVDARVPRKRGKLVRSYGSIEDSVPSYSFVSRNSFERALEVEDRTEAVRKHRSLFDSEKLKLHSRIEECRKSFGRSGESSEDPKDRRLSYRLPASKASSLDLGGGCSGLGSRLHKSQSFACSDFARAKTRDWPKAISLQGRSEFSSQESSDSQSRLVKMQTLANLEDIETDIENMPECGVLEDRFSPGKPHDNYIREGKCQAKLRHSSSFQSGFRLRETKIVSSFEKPSLSASRSFCARNSSLSGSRPDFIKGRQLQLGSSSTTNCYSGSISSVLSEDHFERQISSRRSNISPPPLSTLQIFAISTKPLDIPAAAMDPIPSNVDKLPSLPIQRSECRVESEKKLSILEPPPPGLVSREESTESWNRFLVQLNSILESRAGEFV